LGEPDLLLFRAGDFLSGDLFSGDFRSLPLLTGDREVEEDEDEDRDRYGRRPGDLLGDLLLKGDLLRRPGEPRGYQGDLRRRGEFRGRIGLRARGECLGLVIGARGGKVF